MLVSKTINKYKNKVCDNEITTINQSLSKLLFTRLCHSLRNEFYTNEAQKLQFCCIQAQIRKEYYNDINTCLENFYNFQKSTKECLADDAVSLWFDIQDNELDRNYSELQTIAIHTELLSSNDSTVFMDATDNMYIDEDTGQTSDDDTMKSISRPCNNRLSLENIPAQCVLQDNEQTKLFTAKQQR